MAMQLYSQDMGMSTFGTLKEASQKLSFPSTLTYKERIHLRDCDSVEYQRYENFFCSRYVRNSATI